MRAQRCMNQSREVLDQLAEEDRVDANTLLSFASQIVSGMQHLEQLQVCFYRLSILFFSFFFEVIEIFQELT